MFYVLAGIMIAAVVILPMLRADAVKQQQPKVCPNCGKTTIEAIGKEVDNVKFSPRKRHLGAYVESQVYHNYSYACKSCRHRWTKRIRE